MRTRAAAIRRFIQPAGLPFNRGRPHPCPHRLDGLPRARHAGARPVRHPRYGDPRRGYPVRQAFYRQPPVLPAHARRVCPQHNRCDRDIPACSSGSSGLAGLCGILPPGIPVATLVPAVLAGAILHIATDALAFPGIPLLFPFSDRKITLGILPGRSFFLFGVSAILLLATMLGTVTFPAALWIEAAVITAFLACRAAGYFAVRRRWPGMLVVPTPSPFRFFVIGESGTAYTIRRVSPAGGSSGMEIFEKYTGTDRPGTENLRDLPEVRAAEVPFLWGRGGKNPVRVYLFRSVPREGVFPVSSPSYPGCHSCRSRPLPGVTSPADRCFRQGLPDRSFPGLTRPASRAGDLRERLRPDTTGTALVGPGMQHSTFLCNKQRKCTISLPVPVRDPGGSRFRHHDRYTVCPRIFRARE